MELNGVQMSSIYALTAPGDPATFDCVRYIGKTKNPIEERLRGHVNHAYSRKTKVSCWIRSLIFEGKIPDIHLIDTVPTRFSDDAEIYMKLFFENNGSRLLNMTDGGDGPNNLLPEVRERISKSLTGRKLSLECKEKISNSLIGNTRSVGRTDGRGKKRSKETSDKISASWSGRMTPEFSAKLSACHTGFKHSPESKKKISSTLMGNKRSVGVRQSEECKAKKSLALKGRPKSEETKAKMSAWQKGVPKSPEFRAKTSAGLKRYYAQKNQKDSTQQGLNSNN